MAAQTVISIVSLFFLALYVYLVNYMIQLERIGCECSVDWRRTFIKTYMLFIIIYLSLLFILTLFGKEHMLRFVAMIMFFVNIFFIIVVYQYVKYLKDTKCECSASLARNVLELFNYIQIFLLLFSLLNGIFAILFISHVLKIKSLRK